MKPSEPGPLRDFCHHAGLGPDFRSTQLRAGRNSQVWALHGTNGAWVLKHYHRWPGDSRDRLGTEFDFLAFLRNGGIFNVPEPIALDHDLNCGLYSLLPGSRPAAITDNHIRQAAQFIGAINELRELPAARALPFASDACLNWQDHFKLVEVRIRQLQSLSPREGVESDAQEFIHHRLVPLWNRLWQLAQCPIKLEPAERKLHGWLVLSPSDFGFHNSLLWQDRLSFLDFEYAGWDDPAKLVCDFLCQPEFPVSAAQGQLFKREVLRKIPYAEQLGHRIDQMLPVHRLKWCCLLLNEFKSGDWQRRRHAGLAREGLLNDQLAKAKTYFEDHLA